MSLDKIPQTMTWAKKWKTDTWGTKIKAWISSHNRTEFPIFSFLVFCLRPEGWRVRNRAVSSVTAGRSPCVQPETQRKGLPCAESEEGGDTRSSALCIFPSLSCLTHIGQLHCCGGSSRGRQLRSLPKGDPAHLFSPEKEGKETPVACGVLTNPGYHFLSFISLCFTPKAAPSHTEPHLTGWRGREAKTLIKTCLCFWPEESGTGVSGSHRACGMLGRLNEMKIQDS